MTRCCTFAFALSALLPLTACGGVEEDAGLGLIQQAAMEPSPFRVREDIRSCQSPLCGGFLAHQDGSARTTCADGTTVEDTSCYVATFDWGALNLHPAVQAALQARAAAGQLILSGRMAADLQGKHGNVGQLVITGYRPSGDTWFPDMGGWYPQVAGWHLARTGY